MTYIYGVPLNISISVNISQVSYFVQWTDSEMGRQGVRNPPKNHKNIGFLSNTGPDP